MKMLLIKLKLYLQSVIKNAAKQEQLILISSIFILLSACQRHNFAPREIEMPNNDLLSYKIKNKYLKAISKINGATMVVGTYTTLPPLEIKISGSATSLIDQHPFSFTTRKIKIENNSCKTILLVATDYLNAAPLQICYINKNLYLDPDPYNKENPYLSSIFYPSVLWKIQAELNGIDTHGIAKLKNAKMKIKILK